MRYRMVSEIVDMFEDFSDIEDEMEEAYEKVYAIEDNKLGIEDLVFKKLYGYYKEYEAGKLKEDDKVDIYNGVMMCDKFADEYKLDVSTLFKDMVEEALNGYYEYDDFHDSYSFFPKDVENIDIEENADKLRVFLSNCASYVYMEIKGLSSMLYNHITAEYVPEEITEYIESEDGLNYWDEITGAEIYNIFDYDRFMDYYEEHYTKDYDLITDSSKMKRFSEYLMESEEIDKLIGEFIKIRNKCLETYCILSKIEANKAEELELSEEEINYYSDFYDRTLLLGRDIIEEYSKLSIRDFELDNDCKLHIINNADIYELFGVDVEKEKEMEDEFER